MTTPSKLDEARLRELQRTCEMMKRAGQDAANAPTSLEKANARRAETSMLRLLGQHVPALLDALSAERERGDRAVGLIEEMAPFGLNHTSKWVSTKAQIFLATQKAEGAG